MDKVHRKCLASSIKELEPCLTALVEPFFNDQTTNKETK